MNEEKEFKLKMWILFGIVLCVIAIAFFSGASSYGYPKGVKVAKEYYLEYYIPEFCVCNFDNELASFNISPKLFIFNSTLSEKFNNSR